MFDNLNMQVFVANELLLSKTLWIMNQQLHDLHVIIKCVWFVCFYRIEGHNLFGESYYIS